jgi:hypothetical protein
MAPVRPEPDRIAAVAVYKSVLKRVVDTRPSGTRHKLALALGKNRSFISQITSPTYSVPIPPAHLDTIFEICHFTPAERREFLAAYTQAHSRRLAPDKPKPTGSRSLTLTVPELGDARKNRLLDETITEIVRRIARLAQEE